MLCRARRLGAPSRSVPNFAAKDRFLFYRDLVPGGEFLSQRWERNQWPRPLSLGPTGQFTLRIAGGRLRMSADALIFALPPVPHYEGRSPERSRSFPARKIRSAWVRFFRAHRGPVFAKSAFGAVPLLRLSLPNQRPRSVFRRRGAQCAPAGRRGRRPLRLNRKIPAFRRGGLWLPASGDPKKRKTASLRNNPQESGFLWKISRPASPPARPSADRWARAPAPWYPGPGW